MQFYFDPESGINRPGANPNESQAYGLDPNSVSTRTVGGTPGRAAGWMTAGYAGTPGTQQSVYNGPGGQFTSTGGGAWTDAGGRSISDLPGYLQMRKRMQQGAAFEPYQNQLNQLMTNPAAIQQTPGYQFALEQGNQAINRSAAAKGALNSGGVLAELSRYGQGMASQEYGNQVNRLSDLMRGAQNFGVQAGYYQPPQNVPVGSVGRTPSTW